MLSLTYRVYQFLIYTRYTGDLTVTLSSGLKVRIPNDQLVVSDRYIDDSGELRSNASAQTLVFDSLQDVNKDDLPRIGHRVLSAAYLVLNQDANSFTLWEVDAVSRQELVAIDSDGKSIDSACGDTSTNQQVPSTSSSNPLSSGKIAGIVVGVLASTLIVIIFVYFLMIFRRKQAAYNREDSRVQQDLEGETGEKAGNNELFVTHEILEMNTEADVIELPAS